MSVDFTYMDKIIQLHEDEYVVTLHQLRVYANLLSAWMLLFNLLSRG